MKQKYLLKDVVKEMKELAHKKPTTHGDYDGEVITLETKEGNKYV